MSHRCGGRHPKFHIRTLKEPWTERPILTFSRSQGTHQEPVLLSHNCTSGHRETDTPSTSHIPQRHEHQYTNIYSDKSRPIPPRVAPSHQPRACPLPIYTLRDRTRTGTHGISQTHTQPLLKYTRTHMYAQARVWGHTDAHTQHKPAIPLLCPLIHSQKRWVPPQAAASPWSIPKVRGNTSGLGGGGRRVDQGEGKERRESGRMRKEGCLTD